MDKYLINAIRSKEKLANFHHRLKIQFEDVHEGKESIPRLDPDFCDTFGLEWGGILSETIAMFSVLHPHRTMV